MVESKNNQLNEKENMHTYNWCEITVKPPGFMLVCVYSLEKKKDWTLKQMLLYEEPVNVHHFLV